MTCHVIFLVRSGLETCRYNLIPSQPPQSMPWGRPLCLSLPQILLPFNCSWKQRQQLTKVKCHAVCVSVSFARVWGTYNYCGFVQAYIVIKSGLEVLLAREVQEMSKKVIHSDTFGSLPGSSFNIKKLNKVVFLDLERCVFVFHTLKGFALIHSNFPLPPPPSCARRHELQSST